ncbi:MAG: protoheme IX farnesyltransferase [Bacteroidetes bacterium]|nr:protoheme IX farnesyltransferase [Bacteroidota bacterium]
MEKSFFKDLAVLFKLRLSALVIISSVTGYGMAVESWETRELLCLIIGGILLTGGSNGMNQVWEIELDKLMHRTMNRPLPQDRITLRMATILSVFGAILGVGILWVGLNLACGVLGLSAFILYVFVYTPMKRISSIAVFIGAIPGAIPPMIGYLAPTGHFSLEAGILFAVQFMWQFPHFWAIAWVLQEDYLRAGYKLLPFEEGRTKQSAFQILMYTFFLIPVGMLPWVFPVLQPMIGSMAMWIAIAMGVMMSYYAIKLYRSCEIKDARKLMFASFVYLPVVQIAYVIDQI